MACAICETRRPRRFCPGVRGDICSRCCGEEREVTVNCPLDCEYLQDAHKHEKLPELDVSAFPNKDIRLTERFLDERVELLMLLASTILQGGMETDGAVDYDVREALEGLVRTYRTLESGVYYETVPANPLAANIFRVVQNGVAEARKLETEQTGLTRTRDADVLGCLAFLQRMEYDRNNGRKRGRAFLDFLRTVYTLNPPESDIARPSLIVP